MAEMETNEAKYSALSLGVVLVAAFVLVQPAMMSAYAVTAEDLGYDDCDENEINGGTARSSPAELEMNSVRSGNLVKTIHVEKQKLECNLNQGDLRVAVDVDIYLEVWENINTREIVQTSALVITCVRDADTAATIGCISYTPSTSPVFVGSDCNEETNIFDDDEHPMEMNTVRKNNIIKTIETQKLVFSCGLDGDDTWKKVDLTSFTEIFEDSDTKEVIDVQTYDFRCVVLVTNDNDNSDSEDEVQDGIVESCKFTPIVLVEQ